MTAHSMFYARSDSSKSRTTWEQDVDICRFPTEVTALITVLLGDAQTCSFFFLFLNAYNSDSLVV